MSTLVGIVFAVIGVIKVRYDFDPANSRLAKIIAKIKATRYRVEDQLRRLLRRPPRKRQRVTTSVGLKWNVEPQIASTAESLEVRVSSLEEWRDFLLMVTKQIRDDMQRYDATRQEAEQRVEQLVKELAVGGIFLQSLGALFLLYGAAATLTAVALAH